MGRFILLRFSAHISKLFKILLFVNFIKSPNKLFYQGGGIFGGSAVSFFPLPKLDTYKQKENQA